LEKLVLNANYFSAVEKDSVSISVFRFYVSQFEIYNKGKLVSICNKNAFLIDLSKPETLQQTLDIGVFSSFDKIRFYLGIDDKTNNDGISDGDLDPSNGMYWAWQSGYINIKLEGKFKSDQEFQFHLGGFLKPYVSFQTIELDFLVCKKDIDIVLNLNAFLDSILLEKTNSIMSPCEKSVALSKLAAKMFR
jgi:hypothetical protein